MYVVLLITFQTSFKGSYNIIPNSIYDGKKLKGHACPDGTSSSSTLNSVYYPPRPSEAIWQPRSANSEAVCASPPFCWQPCSAKISHSLSAVLLGLVYEFNHFVSKQS